MESILYLGDWAMRRNKAVAVMMAMKGSSDKAACAQTSRTPAPKPIAPGGHMKKKEDASPPFLYKVRTPPRRRTSGVNGIRCVSPGLQGLFGSLHHQPGGSHER